MKFQHLFLLSIIIFLSTPCFSKDSVKITVKELADGIKGEKINDNKKSKLVKEILEKEGSDYFENLPFEVNVESCGDSVLHVDSISNLNTQLCEAVVQSEVCQKVKNKKELLNCKTLSSDDQGVMISFKDGTLRCGAGLGRGAVTIYKGLLSFIKSALKQTLAMIHYHSMREIDIKNIGEETIKSNAEAFSNLGNYVSNIYESEKEKDDVTETEAVLNTGAQVVIDTYSNLEKTLSEEVDYWHCLNSSGKSGYICSGLMQALLGWLTYDLIRGPPKAILDKATLDKTTLDKATLDKTTLDKATLDKALDKGKLENLGFQGIKKEVIKYQKQLNEIADE